MTIFSWWNQNILGVAVPLFLLVTGVFYLFRLRAFPFLHPIRLLRSVLDSRNRTDGISPLRALSMALAGTLGVGNLVGVSAAIAMGGAGAIFWMWVSATLAMLLKYAEVVLALGHRVMLSGGIRGGAMYYMRDTGKRNRTLGKIAAMVFTVLCLLDAFSMGCVVQVNAVAGALEASFHLPVWAIGLGIALITLAVGATGANGISACTERLVPLMTVGFVVVSAVAIAGQHDRLPHVLGEIFRDALHPKSAAGGVLGFLFSRGMRYGTMRGLLSNEAGCGTSPMAHASSQIKDAATQGCMGIIEVFVDTHVLCTMTALVILLAWDHVSSLGATPMLMTLRAYEALLGHGAGIFLSIAVLFFGLATVLCWSHYAVCCCDYMVGDSRERAIGQWTRRICLWMYSLFCVIGAVVAPAGVWTLSDFSIGNMTLINVVFLCLHHREVENASAVMVGKVSHLLGKKEKSPRR